MKLEDIPNRNGPVSTIAGIGLIALDVIIQENTKCNFELKAGGSCGNVLTILSYLGWKSYPIAHFRPDEASKIIMRDMVKWGVDTSLLLEDENGSTPIIIEVIKKTKNGSPTHRFLWTCPDCGSYLPRFKAVRKRDIPRVINKLPKSNVFYLDRVTSSSVEFAKVYKKKGALIFFEPNGVKNREQFLECAALADIVKYSHQMMGRFKELLIEIDSPLIIETLGAKGLRFHYNKGIDMLKWKSAPAFAIDQLKDAVGAGDWCSAGIIHALCRSGIEGFENSTVDDIEKAIKYGQALSAINCQFEGARGAMYSISQDKLTELANALCDERKNIDFINISRNREVAFSMVQLCPDCRRRDPQYSNKDISITRKTY